MKGQIYSCKEVDGGVRDGVRENCRPKKSDRAYGGRDNCFQHANHTLTLFSVSEEDVSSYVCQLVMKRSIQKPFGSNILSLEHTLMPEGNPNKITEQDTSAKAKPTFIVIVVLIMCMLLIAIIVITIKVRNSK